MEVRDLSSREIEPDRAIASGTHAAIGQAQRLATAFSKSSFEPSDFLPMFDYPKFHNEIGVPIVRVGCREFKCIGAKPPQDHQLFRFDPSLGAHEADPADCAYGDMD